MEILAATYIYDSASTDARDKLSVRRTVLTIRQTSYDRFMTDSSQFVNGLWMGTLLIIVGLVPGLLDRCAKSISDAANTLSFRFPVSMSSRFPLQPAKSSQIDQPRWLAALGMAIIALAFFAYIAR
jgi:hypothetical protein